MPVSLLDAADRVFVHDDLVVDGSIVFPDDTLGKEIHAGCDYLFFFLPGKIPMSLQIIPSMISSAPPPIERSRESR